MFSPHKLKARRKQADMTQAELCRRLESHDKYISKLETGRHIPSLPMLEALARVLKCKITDLME